MIRMKIPELLLVCIICASVSKLTADTAVSVYVVTRTGNTCSDEGMVDLDDGSECQTAIIDIQDEIPGAIFENERFSDARPAGCYSSGYLAMMIFWNTHSQGSPCRNCRSICKDPTTTPAPTTPNVAAVVETNEYVQSNKDSACCVSDYKIHRRCVCNDISDLAQCRSLCSSDPGCKAYVVAETRPVDRCNLATTSVCPDDCMGPFQAEEENIGPIDLHAECYAGGWNGGCLVKNETIPTTTTAPVETTATTEGWSCTAATWSNAPGNEFKTCRQSLIDCQRCVNAESVVYTWLSWRPNLHCWGLTQEPSNRGPGTTVTLCHTDTAQQTEGPTEAPTEGPNEAPTLEPTKGPYSDNFEETQGSCRNQNGQVADIFSSSSITLVQCKSKCNAMNAKHGCNAVSYRAGDGQCYGLSMKASTTSEKVWKCYSRTMDVGESQGGSNEDQDSNVEDEEDEDDEDEEVDDDDDEYEEVDDDDDDDLYGTEREITRDFIPMREEEFRGRDLLSILSFLPVPKILVVLGEMF